jgi:hypothetical protein
LALIGIVGGAVVGAVIGAITANTIAKEKGVEGKQLALETTLGAVCGAAVGGTLGACGAAVVTKLTGIVGFSVTRVSILPIRNLTLLGNMPGYVDAANVVNAGFYQISEKVEQSLPVAQQVANNAQYLEDAYALGSQFILSPDKVIEVGKRFWMEVQFLMDNGIPWIMP